MNRHARLIKVGLDSNPIHASKLIADYTSSSSSYYLTQAHRIFNQVPCESKDTALWASLISAFVRSSQPHHALRLFSLMLRRSQSACPNTRPNSYVFTSLARAVASAPEELRSGEALHAHIIKCGAVHEEVFVGTAFVDMYAKCGVVACAFKVFDEMRERNLVTWNAMISGFVRNAMGMDGLRFFKKMKDREMCWPDEFTVSTVLSSCADIQDLVLGRQVHGFAISSGVELYCVNAISNMYFYCGEVECAKKSFDGIGGDVLSSLIKIRGNVFNHRYCSALKCVVDCNDVEILYWDPNVIVALLTVCSRLSLLKVGKQLHGLIVTLSEVCYGLNLGEDEAAFIGCAVIDMYSKCGDIISARIVYDSWLARHVSLCNSMVTGYMHNDMIKEARNLFEAMPEKNVISWTSLMAGYVQNGMPDEALLLVSRMHSIPEGFTLHGNSSTFVVVLEACSYLTDLERGKQIHGKIVRYLGNSAVENVMVGTALVDMYSKAGKLQYARIVFDAMTEKNVIAWTSIITGFAVHGHCHEAIDVFQQMVGMGIEPNEVTFIAVLTACSHCGLVDEGLHYYKMMTKKYNLIPGDDHHTCLIDMLGRFGRLDEAWLLLKEIEETGDRCSNENAWASFLGACHSQGNVKLGERAAIKMLEHRKQVSISSIALSNVYAAAGMWKEAFRARKSRKNEGCTTAEPGLSRICMH